MTDFFQQLTLWVTMNPDYAYAAVFIVAMAESLAVIGIIVPGVVMMFAFGALIVTGALGFWPTVAWATAGAIAGDSLSFFLGRFFKTSLIRTWPFSSHPKMLLRGIEFFRKYGVKSILLGRFIGPVRAIIPMVAGMMHMSSGKFLAANIGSALLWAPAYLLPGMVFGASLELASEVGLRLVVLLVFTLILLWTIMWLVKLIFRLFQPHAKNSVRSVLRWAKAHPVAGEMATALTDPNHPEAGGLAVFSALLILATIGFTLVTGAVWEGSFFIQPNRIVLETLQSLRTPWADHLLIHASRFTNLQVALSLALGVLAYLTWQREWRTAIYWVTASLFALIVPELLKISLEVPRPNMGIAAVESSWAFPSGHTLAATVLFGFLAIISARSMPLNWRWLPYTLAALMVTSVALSRLYLGVHWLSDILGSITLGLIWVSVLGIAYNRHITHSVGWISFSLTTTFFFVFAITAQTWLHHGEEVASYQPKPPQMVMDAEIWWINGWEMLPKTRQDLRAKAEHPMNLQYAGSLEGLKKVLGENGWKEARQLNWTNSLELLSTTLPLPKIPVLPQVHDGHHEQLTLEKVDGNNRLILRLWPTNVRINTPDAPLWIGNVSAQIRADLLGLVVYPVTDTDFAMPYQVLLRDSGKIPHRQPDTENDLILLSASPSELAPQAKPGAKMTTRPLVPLKPASLKSALVTPSGHQLMPNA